MKKPLLKPLLDEEVRFFRYPRFGSKAYRFCSQHLQPEHCGCEHHAISCSLNRIIHWYESEYMHMARKKTPPAWGNITFVKYELSGEEKKQFVEWTRKTSNQVDDLVQTLLTDGNKLTFSFNAQTDSYIVSVTGRDEGSINFERCFTSHGKTYFIALTVALFKYHVVWERGTWEDRDNDEDFG